jgi:hypothetical protein
VRSSALIATELKLLIVGLAKRQAIGEDLMTSSDRNSYRWDFRTRFRRNAFGWRSQPAIQRVKQAVSEIKKVARRDPVLGGEGAVLFLERLSPALEHVDSSSGSIGTAVNNAIGALVPIIAEAPADEKTRGIWLQRLWDAHEADEIPYIEILSEFWGELCGSKEVASVWADELVDITRMALSPDPSLHGYFHGTSACLSALYRAERFEEIVDILSVDTHWSYKRWAVKALVALGKKSEAIRYAESCRGPYTYDSQVDSICEEILLSSGSIEEAYARYGLVANNRGTFLATFRALSEKYPQKSPSELLSDLVETTPGQEAKWFAAAKDAGLYDEAITLAASSPCDPKTLARAARDFADNEPAFALDAGLLALRWLVEGFGYDVTGSDVWGAYSSVMKAAVNLGTEIETREELSGLVSTERPRGFVAKILGRELGL